ncbi:Ca2+-dependent phosphoinositide-specific phospholipase C [Paraburkholderia atlantica]|uniref:Ca2+-dependent phosphoinositide-specific phospholipase C n=1 Tax=Paraburkholderia atlantica TaxID=2654982 RepID=UPI00161C7A02|nr:Ca2+-dependent phosphoinositide-specific phospholipase C [Paraburkholderia atlantica]MBB5421744.1 hypothetical protein [Paraburkholderia atlantica]
MIAANVYDGASWSGWQTIPGKVGTANALAATAYGDSLAIVAVGYDQHHYVQTAKAPSARPAFPRYNQVYGVATHNSYWVNRSDQVDYHASGTQELLSDQLLHEHIRAIELDVHSEGAPAHEWKVYHTSDSEDFTCRYLSDCLEYLRNFHYAVPNHEAINVVVELKNVVSQSGTYTLTIPTNYNFDSNHTQNDFDTLIRNKLGGALYTPADFLAKCPAGTTLRDCAKMHPNDAWPTVDQLRGVWRQLELPPATTKIAAL